MEASQASATSRHSRRWVSSIVSFDPFPCLPYLVPLVWIFGWRAGLFGFRYPVAAVLFPVPCPLVLGATFPCTCLCVPTPATFLFVSAAFGFGFVSSTFEVVCPCFDRFKSVPIDVRREVVSFVSVFVFVVTSPAPHGTDRSFRSFWGIDRAPLFCAFFSHVSCTLLRTVLLGPVVVVVVVVVFFFFSRRCTRCGVVRPGAAEWVRRVCFGQLFLSMVSSSSHVGLSFSSLVLRVWFVSFRSLCLASRTIEQQVGGSVDVFVAFRQHGSHVFFVGSGDFHHPFHRLFPCVSTFSMCSASTTPTIASIAVLSPFRRHGRLQPRRHTHVGDLSPSLLPRRVSSLLSEKDGPCVERGQRRGEEREEGSVVGVGSGSPCASSSKVACGRTQR